MKKFSLLVFSITLMISNDAYCLSIISGEFYSRYREEVVDGGFERLSLTKDYMFSAKDSLGSDTSDSLAQSQYASFGLLDPYSINFMATTDGVSNFEAHSIAQFSFREDFLCTAADPFHHAGRGFVSEFGMPGTPGTGWIADLDPLSVGSISFAATTTLANTSTGDVEFDVKYFNLIVDHGLFSMDTNLDYFGSLPDGTFHLGGSSVMALNYSVGDTGYSAINYTLLVNLSEPEHVSPIPEPATIFLLCTGFLGMVAATSKKIFKTI